MKSGHKLEDDLKNAVVRAAMRYYRSFLKVGTRWDYQYVPHRIENGLINACHRIFVKRGKK